MKTTDRFTHELVGGDVVAVARGTIPGVRGPIYSRYMLASPPKPSNCRWVTVHRAYLPTPGGESDTAIVDFTDGGQAIVAEPAHCAWYVQVPLADTVLPSLTKGTPS